MTASAIAMEGEDKVETIIALQQDLVALSEGQLPNVDKLCADLEAQLTAFQKLLDKKPRSEKSRAAINTGWSTNLTMDTILTTTGKIIIGEVDYTLNEEFKDQAIKLADDLELDQQECAELLILGGKDAESLDRSQISCAVIRFHQYRTFLLDCLRLVLKISLDVDIREDYRDTMSTLR